MTDLSLAYVVRALADGTFRHKRSPELDAVRAFEERSGPVEALPDHAVKLAPDFLLPPRVRERMTRALTAYASSLGGYMVATGLVGDYFPALVPYHWPILSKLAVYPAPPSGGRSFPVGASQVTVTWQTPDTGTITEETQEFGAVSSTPHGLTAYLNASRLLLLQSNADQILQMELARAGSTAFLKALVQGSGVSGQPKGILGTTGVSTATGASFAYANAVTAMQTVASGDAVVDPSALAWAANPAVAGTLKGRFISAANVTPIWEGGIPSGSIQATPAYTSTAVPAASAVYGDWSSAGVVEYPSGAMLEVDPFTNFKSAQYGMRLTLYVDVIVRYPTSFYTFTAVT